MDASIPPMGPRALNRAFNHRKQPRYELMVSFAFSLSTFGIPFTTRVCAVVPSAPTALMTAATCTEDIRAMQSQASLRIPIVPLLLESSPVLIQRGPLTLQLCPLPTQLRLRLLRSRQRPLALLHHARVRRRCRPEHGHIALRVSHVCE